MILDLAKTLYLFCLCLGAIFSIRSTQCFSLCLEEELQDFRSDLKSYTYVAAFLLLCIIYETKETHLFGKTVKVGG